MTSHGFTLVREGRVEELSSTVRLYTHDKTGGQLASFVNADENKVFGVSFRTPPADSTGVAHILEHSVLCGSKKYPVKEPFVELLKGSLQTFLNAFTYPDKTCYPVASVNLQDFRNLVDVYLDAVFFPVISENIFMQEGWHIEQEGQELSYKGVVYNEMKGAFSSPESVLARHCLHSLFPDTVYGLESGGDPEAIPDLSYEEFTRFHATYYHPSNARFFFWGDDNEEERLHQLGAVLDQFSAITPCSEIALQARLPEPVFTEVAFPASEGEGEKGMVVVNWLGPDVMDMETGLAFRILEHILLGMPASPLRRALIESGLGEDIAGQGLESELRQLAFDAGLKGIAPEHAAKVEELVLATLRQLVENGIPSECVEAAINSVEFDLRENNTGRFPVGLAIMLRSLVTWLHNGDPLAPLRFEAPLAEIKGRVASGEWYFEELIRCWLLENPHRVTVSLVPDTKLAEQQEQNEQERLALAVSAMSGTERETLARKAGELAEWQATPDSPEALASIPRLGVADLPRTNALIPGEDLDAAAPIFFHALPTGGIVYVEAAFDLGGLDNSQFDLLPLFGRALLEMGTAQHDFVALNMEIARKTGGMDAGSLFVSRLGEEAACAKLVIEGKTTPDKIDGLFALMEEVTTGPHFDQKDRFLRMVLEEKARMEHGLVPAGHMVVAARLKAGFSGTGLLGERTGGVSYLLYLRELAEKTEKEWPAVLAALNDLRKALFFRSNLVFNITGMKEQQAPLCHHAAHFARALPPGEREGAGETLVRLSPRILPAGEGLVLPAQVNYVGKGMNLFQHGYTWHGSAQVIIKHLRTGYLWERVRVQGGAYGCLCGLDRATGAFYMVSYRDPAVLPTLGVFDAAGAYLQKNLPSGAALEAAIVGAVGELDAHLLPDAKGRMAFTRRLSGDTDELRQQVREEILGATARHFREFGEALEAFSAKGHVCALGGKAVERVAAEGGWTSVAVL